MPLRFIKALFGKTDHSLVENFKEKFCVINQRENELVCFIPDKEKGFKITFLEKNKALLNVDDNIKVLTFKDIQDLVNKIYREIDKYLPIDVNRISLIEAVRDLKRYRINLLESSPHYTNISKSVEEILEKLNQKGANYFKSKTGLGC